MAEKPIKRTQYAQQGLDFTTLFRAKFGRADVSGHVPMLQEPPAESTGGGARALQHLVLEPTAGGPVLTVGSVNVVTRTAKLRTFDCVETIFLTRFQGRPFILEQGAYQEFFDQAREFFQRQGMQLDVETRPPEVGPRSLSPASKPPTDNTFLFVMVGIIIVLGVSLVAAVLTGRLSF